jgi:hypothetical protein
MTITNIYLISDNVNTYVGSTYKDINTRYRQHKINHDLYTVTLLATYDTVDYKHRLMYEQLWINKIRPTMNKLPPFNPLVRCMHNRIRAYCKNCNGKHVCHHGIRKYACIPCKGSSICQHNKQRHQCIDCTPVTCERCHKVYTKAAIKRHANHDNDKCLLYC